MPALVEAALVAWQDAQGGGVYVCEVSGVWQRKDTLSKRFRAFAGRVGLGRLTFHGLRHTAASLLIGSGLDVRTASTVLGHAQPSTTLNIYSHLIDDAAHRAAQVLQDGLVPQEAITSDSEKM